MMQWSQLQGGEGGKIFPYAQKTKTFVNSLNNTTESKNFLPSEQNIAQAPLIWEVD